MKYTKEERLDIDRRIYDGEISRYQAAEIYDISEQTTRDYMRLYRDTEQFPPKRAVKNTIKAPSFQTAPAGMEDLETMTKEQLIQELVKARITEARLKKRIRGEGGWYGNSVRQREYQVIMELSGEFPVMLLCETMGIQRSSFYSWKKHLSDPSDRTRSFVSNILLFQEYYLKYSSHGYRWLNAKIRLDTGLVLSDPYAHKCCKTAGIQEQSQALQIQETRRSLPRISQSASV